MPLTGTYEWVDRNDTVVVTIPLKGVSPSKVDIVATKATLKVNFSPYIIDIVLSGYIDPNQHKARVRNGALVVTLKKLSPGKWPSLANTSDSADAIKAESLREHEELQQQQMERRKDRRINDERFSTRSQMALDERERTRLDNLKLEEKTRAEEEVYRTFEELEKTRWGKTNAAAPDVAAAKREGNLGAKSSTGDIFDDDDLSHADIVNEILGDGDGEDPVSDDEQEGRSQEESDATHIFENVNGADELDDDVVYVPPPRAPQKVQLDFTPRLFPTPMRESAKAQEEDWIAKNRKHLKKHGVYAANHRAGLTNKKKTGGNISEEDPVWLKAKGDEYYRHNDYLSAINAYSTALDLDETMVSCYSNRSICYLAQCMYADCIEDCDDAIRLLIGNHTTKNEQGEAMHNLTEHTLAENQMLVKLYMRKASAKCQLGLYPDAISANDLASTFHKEVCGYFNNPENSKSVTPAQQTAAEALIQTLEQDREKLELLDKAEKCKIRGDQHIGAGEVEEAMQMYSDALKLVPVYVSCLSNRSACHLARGDAQGCVDDCSLAITLLQHDAKAGGQSSGGLIALGREKGGGVGGHESMLKSILPAEGTDKRKQWLLKTVVRRGAAYFQLGMLDEAVADYGYASSLDQRNEALKKDLTRIINTRANMNTANGPSIPNTANTPTGSGESGAIGGEKG